MKETKQKWGKYGQNFSDRVENILEKEDFTMNEQFIHFPHEV